MPSYKYVVTAPFHGYEKGQEITDPEEIQQILIDHEQRVVRVLVPDDVPPTPLETTGE